MDRGQNVHFKVLNLQYYVDCGQQPTPDLSPENHLGEIGLVPRNSMPPLKMMMIVDIARVSSAITKVFEIGGGDGGFEL